MRLLLLIFIELSIGRRLLKNEHDRDLQFNVKESCALPEDTDDLSEIVDANKCNVWMATISSFPGENLTSVEVNFFPDENNACTYNMYMVGLCPISVSCTLEEIRKLPYCWLKCTNTTINIFHDIPYGNYCVQIQPLHKTCNFEICRSLHGGFIMLENKTVLPPPPKKKLEDDTVSTVLIYTIPLISISVGLICAFQKVWFMYQKYIKEVKSVKKGKELGVVSVLIPIQTQLPISVEVLLLFCQDCIELAKYLEEILLKSFNIRKVCSILSEEEEARIILKGIDWVKETLDLYLEVFKNDDVSISEVRRKVIILESPMASKYQDLKIYNQKQYQTLMASNVDYYDLLFMNAITRITANLTASLQDYRHIYIVRSENMPNEVKLQNMTQLRKFSIPCHLTDLYNALWELSV